MSPLTSLALSIPTEVEALAFGVLTYFVLLGVVALGVWALDRLDAFWNPPVVARQCGWCFDYPTARDEALASEGLPVSSFCCPSCEARAYREAGVEVER